MKDIVKTLTSRVMELHEATCNVQGKHYCFYHGEAHAKNLFAAFLLAGNALEVGIRTDPGISFEDPERWTQDGGRKAYFLWWLGKKLKRGFTVTKKEQIEYAMELITQAYVQTHPIPRERIKTGMRAQKWRP